METQILFIVGMHRSGTSALAAAFASCGAVVSGNTLPDMPGVNPIGFWEDESMVALNDDLLRGAGQEWYSIGSSHGSFEFDEQACLRGKAVILNGLHRGKVHMFKDPRLCLTLPFWIRICEELNLAYKVCMVSRDVEEVAMSLSKRDGFPASYSKSLADYYNDKILKTLRAGVKYSAINYSDLLVRANQELCRLISELSLPLSPSETAIDKIINIKHRHHLADTALRVSSPEPAEIEDILGDVMKVFVGRAEQLSAIGEKHSKALEVIDLRDKQVLELDQRLSAIGEKHSKALEVIDLRDKQVLELRDKQAIYMPLQPAVKNKRNVDIIVPVYKGLEETKACIQSVLPNLDRSIERLTVIIDASPDSALVDWLVAKSSSEDFELLFNEENLGFVATVNRGMRLFPENDVLLLNSDVEVSGDWLTRLREAAYVTERTASLTPFSNNATICSFPMFCKDNDLPWGLSVGQIDKQFAELFGPSDRVQVPTGVGFCMYIRRDCLNDVGYFDVETFGKGYGEENDWCQRAENRGWINFHQANVFVYHKGGVSFALEQDPRKEKALELLAEKHPDYGHTVQKYIAADPAKNFRSEALWHLFASSRLPKIVNISHNRGGGVQQHLGELSRFFHEKALFLELMPHEDEGSVSLSLSCNGHSFSEAIIYDVEKDYDQLVSMLKNLGVSHVHFHHAMGLHLKIFWLARDLGCQYDVTVHDYYLVNGNPTLTSENGVFVGDQSGSYFGEECARAYPIPCSYQDWVSGQKTWLEGALRVIFPSSDALKRYARIFTLQQFVVSPHPDSLMSHPYPIPELSNDKSQTFRVLVLGALSREKGADFFERVAVKNDSCEFHLLGYAYRPLSDPVITHGPYANKDLLGLIQGLNPDVIWFPAQWPETYSYTLSTALEAGVPVVVPNIGAFPERVYNRPHSVVLPWDLSVGEMSQFWSRVAAERTFKKEGNISDCAPEYSSDFYPHEYLAKIPRCLGGDSRVKNFTVSGRLSARPSELTIAERVLQGAWGWSRKSPIGRLAVRLLPQTAKGLIKKALRARPMNEILAKGSGK